MYNYKKSAKNIRLNSLSYNATKHMYTLLRLIQRQTLLKPLPDSGQKNIIWGIMQLLIVSILAGVNLDGNSGRWD